MLTLETWNKLSKAETYQIYKELYQKENKTLSLLLEKMEQTSKLLVNVTNNPENGKNLQDIGERNQKQSREFKPIKIGANTQNLVIGNSIIARIPKNSLPEDVEIHAYRGSTTVEKIDTIKKNVLPNSTLKSLTIQDATNTILKSPEKTIPQLVEDSLQLLKSTETHFGVEKIFWCEVPPIRNLENNKELNEKIKLFNESMEQALMSHTCVEIIRLHQQIRALEDKRKIYYDKIHLNHKFGLPIIRNCILKNLMPFSSNIPRMNATENVETRGFYNNQCDQSSRVFHDTTSYRRPRTWQTHSRYHPQTSYYYMNGQV